MYIAAVDEKKVQFSLQFYKFIYSLVFLVWTPADLYTTIALFSYAYNPAVHYAELHPEEEKAQQGVNVSPEFGSHPVMLPQDQQFMAGVPVVLPPSNAP